MRERILNEHTELAKEITAGRLFSVQWLETLLNELPQHDPGILTAVIWATQFKGPGGEALFRILVPLVESNTSPRLETKVVPPNDDQAKSLRAKYQASVKARERAKQAAESVTRDLRQKDRALQKLQTELEEANKKLGEFSQEVEHAQHRLRDKDAQNSSLEQEVSRGTKVNSALRRENQRLQKTQSESELRRSDLGRLLAAQRRHVEQLTFQIAALPTGSDAVVAFLRREEERIQADKIICSGGPKMRAEEEWRLHRKLEQAFLEAYPQYRQPPPVRIRPKSTLRLLALGGSNEIGRSCYLLELGKHRILVDCGIKPSSTADLYPEIDQLDRVDALILTHAHTDHIGWVPALVRKFPDLGIYCSDGTAALLPVMLDDCRQHYTRKMAIQHERAQYMRNASVVEEQYDLGNVHRVASLLNLCNFDEEEALPFGDVSIKFYCAGHILGAASILIKDQSGRRVFFSGDFSSFPQLTVPAANWPHDLGEVDLLVLESTYGDKEQHTPPDESRRELVSFVRQTVESDGSVILASFGLGRAQELLKLLVTAKEDGDLPAVTIYVDGMIKRINPIYRQLASFGISPDTYYEVSGEFERQEVVLAARTRPCIIVTTSGMLAGGPVVHYAQHLLHDPRHRIVLTGYQDEGAPSRAVRQITGPGRRMVAVENEQGETVEFEAANPAKEVGLSAHADRRGLIEYAGRLRPKHIALVHGEPVKQAILRQHLLQLHPKSEVVCGPSNLPIL